MGMQCHLNIKDLPDFTFQIIYDCESESYTYTEPKTGYIFDCNVEGNAWFDIGQLSDSSQLKLQWLIKNRVCFTCS